LSLASGGEARESDTGFYYAKENEKFLPAPPAGVACRVLGREKNKKPCRTCIFSRGVLHSCDVESRGSHTGAENVGPILLHSTGLTNGARSPARGRMGRRKFITGDGGTEQEQEKETSLTCRGPGLQDARRAAKQVNKHTRSFGLPHASR
jgi:hypothetical protein